MVSLLMKSVETSRPMSTAALASQKPRWAPAPTLVLPAVSSAIAAKKTQSMKEKRYTE